jgi:predicted transposase YdaD
VARGPGEPTSSSPAADPNPFDRRIKSFIGLFPAELVAWLLKEKPLEVLAVDPNIALTEERRSDKLILAVLAGQPPVAVHVDFQTEGRRNVPERMARFQLLSASSKEVKERGARLASFVVYLDRKTYRKDPGRFELPAVSGTSHVATYTVVKLWEEDPAPILAMESPGLCPFLPLMRGKPRELFVESRRKIEGAPEAVLPESTRRLLLAVMTVLSTRVIADRAFLKQCMTEVEAMGNNWMIDWLEQRGEEKGRVKGHAEGRAEGRTAEARRGVLRVIERRFGEAPPDLRAQVEGLTAIARLELLLDEAVTCASLSEFRELLDAP